jgi:hypothetical protein
MPTLLDSGFTRSLHCYIRGTCGRTRSNTYSNRNICNRTPSPRIDFYPVVRRLIMGQQIFISFEDRIESRTQRYCKPAECLAAVRSNTQRRKSICFNGPVRRVEKPHDSERVPSKSAWSCSPIGERSAMKTARSERAYAPGQLGHAEHFQVRFPRGNLAEILERIGGCLCEVLRNRAWGYFPYGKPGNSEVSRLSGNFRILPGNPSIPRADATRASHIFRVKFEPVSPVEASFRLIDISSQMSERFG